MKTAKLPIVFYETNKISQMHVGESGWIVPWGMWVNEYGECYLNSNYTIRNEKGGTSSVLVTRTNNGYVVDLRFCESKFTPNKSPSYLGDNEFIPVSEIIQ